MNAELIVHFAPFDLGISPPLMCKPDRLSGFQKRWLTFPYYSDFQTRTCTSNPVAYRRSTIKANEVAFGSSFDSPYGDDGDIPRFFII